MEVSKFLINKRRELGLSQEEFATYLDVSRSCLSKLEHGSVPSPRTLKKIVHKVGPVEYNSTSKEVQILELLKNCKFKFKNEFETISVDVVDVNMGISTDNIEVQLKRRVY